MIGEIPLTKPARFWVNHCSTRFGTPKNRSGQDSGCRQLFLQLFLGCVSDLPSIGIGGVETGVSGANGAMRLVTLAGCTKRPGLAL